MFIRRNSRQASENIGRRKGKKKAKSVDDELPVVVSVRVVETAAGSIEVEAAGWNAEVEDAAKSDDEPNRGGVRGTGRNE